MESFSSEYSYESFAEHLKNSESAKKLRELIASNIKKNKKLPIDVDITEYYKENKGDFELIMTYMSDELSKIGWRVEYEIDDKTDDTVISLDKLNSQDEESCNIV